VKIEAQIQPQDGDPDKFQVVIIILMFNRWWTSPPVKLQAHDLAAARREAAGRIARLKAALNGPELEAEVTYPQYHAVGKAKEWKLREVP
jgi:hypothetical protein